MTTPNRTQNELVMENKYRNQPCECGSGIKTKKCFPNHITKVKVYDCGDLIIKTDLPQLQKELNEKFSKGGMSFMELYKLQDKYPTPILIGGFGKKDNWNVYQSDMGSIQGGLN